MSRELDVPGVTKPAEIRTFEFTGEVVPSGHDPKIFPTGVLVGASSVAMELVDRAETNEALNIQIVEDPEFGKVVQVVDETGTFAGYDVTTDQIYEAATQAGMEGRRADDVWLNTQRFYGAVVRAAIQGRRDDREEARGNPPRRGVIRDPSDSESIYDDLANGFKRPYDLPKGDK